MANGSKQFFEKLKVGKMGEAVVFKKIIMRRHWNSPKPPALEGAIINPEHIMCQAQIWTDTSEERKHNKDFIMSVNACNTCKFFDCQYREYKPYPNDVIDQKHEVKTNEATHSIESGRTGNLFIEYLSNITTDNQEKPGWFKREPLASWYHFYQPITPINPDVPADEQEQFKREMTTTDRLILNSEFGYIISITGAKLKEIEPILCQKWDNGTSKKMKLTNESGTESEGTIIPVIDILNDYRYFNENQSDIVYTPVLDVIAGTKESTESSPTYYLHKTHYDSIFINQNKDVVEPSPIDRKPWEYVDTFNNAFTFDGEFVLDNVPYIDGKHVNLKIVDGWARAELNGDVFVIGKMIVDGEEKKNIYSITIPKNEQIQFESEGKVWAISHNYVKEYDSKRINFQVKNQYGKNQLLIVTKPYVALLKSTKSWG